MNAIDVFNKDNSVVESALFRVNKRRPFYYLKRSAVCIQ